MKNYPKAGDVVTCEAGHKLYRVLRDQSRDRAISAKDFERIDERMPQPVQCERFARRCHCGAAWWRGNGRGGHQFHFEEGWRP